MIGTFHAVGPALLRNLIDDPDSLPSVLFPGKGDPAGPTLDVDKAWQGLHFLLTGDPWEGDPPLALAVLGGQDFDTDADIGTTRFLTPEQVRTVTAALEATTRTQLERRFSQRAFEEADIYPAIWDEGPDAADYVLDHYDLLVAFYGNAAGRGDAVVKSFG